MSDFTDLELEKEIDELDADEARQTLTDFMDAHKQNQEAHDDLRTELSDKNDTIEDLEDRVAEFKQKRAEKAAEYANMPAGLLADRFDFSELDSIIEEGEEKAPEFSEGEDEEPEGDEGEQYLEFTEREEKGEAGSERSPTEYRERAEEKLTNTGFLQRE